jgi:MerR family redox-sensitive transcriptional activator SoxR
VHAAPCDQRIERTVKVKVNFMSSDLSIGAVSERSGIAPSALRYYESQGLIFSTRSDSGQRRYKRDVLRRVGFIRVAQQVGLSLEEIHDALASLPDNRTPTEKDWHRLSSAWQPRIRSQIELLERLSERLDSCIGCGCLSLRSCRILNPHDVAAEGGTGPRYILDEEG